MKGDILIINENHRKAAMQIAGMLLGDIRASRGKYFITVAGESGAGKSETAAALAEELEASGINVLVIQQDDFFVYPPKTNAAMRIQTGGQVGPEEVRMDLLNGIIQFVRHGEETFTKPLVIFAEDKIISETVDTRPFEVIIIEGTYTTMLEDVDCRVFIDRNLDDTRADRLKRNREKQDEFLEKILMTEHQIISGHRHLASIIVTRDFNAEKN